MFAVMAMIFASCHTQDCDEIPQKFTSYSEAIRVIKSNKFKIKDSTNVSNSFLMIRANYYSCDGRTGFFFYTRNTGSEYFHRGVPIEIWREFKKTSSKQSYYDNNIKDQYRSVITVQKIN